MQQSRIDVLDALRGYALMGLFLIHMVEYYEIYWLNPIPHPLNDALFMVFGGKAFAIFAFLFGVSFYILLG
ncbi:MAG TPA: heparan-alpha-glucosaminide N-acetyltransferase domain-containing protein, partial [Cellvibrionaceae bacterium]|nr:heparan-alpha-glucosaminide N-acetyltransferase domain-containing protein [Cellvibrionaceae bacterium]